MYNKLPMIKVSDSEKVIKGYEKIYEKLWNIDKLVFECYPGVDEQYLNCELLLKFSGYEIFNISDCLIDKDSMQETIKKYITNDRIFGYMSNSTIDEFFDNEKITKLKLTLQTKEKYIVYGFGASEILTNEQICYVNMARWEIQKRHRNGLTNWNFDNCDMDPLTKFKIGYFFEWRVADRLKQQILPSASFVLDVNDNQQPKMITQGDYISALEKTSETPFRLVPFFDPGVWGGQWMKQKFKLDQVQPNFAWSFDGVPEENSINLKFGSEYVEMPAIDVVLFQGRRLLGEKVHARFGLEFPIRFDLLDTIEGQNLSLQVHPTTEYIQEKFGMNYTQDESYYILDTNKDEDPHVYIGFKAGIDKDEFITKLKYAQDNGNPFDVEKYVNKIPCKKHDHFLIPAGTIHCSGSGTMVLEVSSTPYIFTFKLWDWERVGLDGKPRAINIEHGEKVLDFSRDKKFVKEQLVNNITRVSECEEVTGLHEREFIETRRYYTEESVVLKTNGSVNVLNLISGEQAVISSPKGKFEDYIVNYAETFIVPAAVDEYEVKATDGKIGLLKAEVR